MNQNYFLEKAEFSCSDINQLLDSHLEKKLVGENQMKFNNHLENCECCKKLVSDMSYVLGVAKTLKEVTIPDGVRVRLRQHLNKHVGHNVFALRPNTSIIK
jgi:predicted anti-sigma-YlaC factor YlaD